MQTSFSRFAIVATALLACTASAETTPALRPDQHGTYIVHLLLHAIGTEDYTLTTLPQGYSTLNTSSTSSDRGMKRASSTTLDLGPRLTPIHLQQTVTAGGADTVSVTDLTDTQVHVQEPAGTRTFARPALAFPGAGGTPAPLLMMLMRYWQQHGQPVKLDLLRGSDQALPLEIRAVGTDTITLSGKPVTLRRYTLANLAFGHEIVWMDPHENLAAVMTFAAGLPQEIVLDTYESATAELFRRGVQQQMRELAALNRQVRPQISGTYAIKDVRLIDGLGAPPQLHSTVLIRAGKIVAIGQHIQLPRGTRIINGSGHSLLPGLWEMHSHYSGVEFGPALLAAGITTARDCGGERDFLLAVRQQINAGALGPRLLLAGLIDSGGPLAFGNTIVETPEQARRAVQTYAEDGFEQVKVYTQIKPEILKTIAAEAHSRGLTVTGHVPAAVDTPTGIEDGMDQINHLQFVTRELNGQGKDSQAKDVQGKDAQGKDPFDPHSARAEKFFALMQSHHTVVDPTAAWGEMASHPKGVDVATFESGIAAAPWIVASKFQSIGSTGPAAEKFADRMKLNLDVIAALHRAHIPIVAGSDTNLLGYGLDRELELYVKAGMTPLEAIQTATLIPAQVMHHVADSGSIEAGKRADLVLVDGDPSENISDLRRVVSVITAGRLYSAPALAATVGFHR